jgi:hypothetical protein
VGHDGREGDDGCDEGIKRQRTVKVTGIEDDNGNGDSAEREQQDRGEIRRAVSSLVSLSSSASQRLRLPYVYVW